MSFDVRLGPARTTTHVFETEFTQRAGGDFGFAAVAVFLGADDSEFVGSEATGGSAAGSGATFLICSPAGSTLGDMATLSVVRFGAARVSVDVTLLTVDGVEFESRASR